MPGRAFVSFLASWWLLSACAPSTNDAARLEGAWTAVSAQRDGVAAADVLGHQLTFTGDRFEIRSRDGEVLFAGTFRTESTATPASIDFDHTVGTVSGRSWEGIYALDGDTLTICDDAPNIDALRPTAFEAARGSGYVLITFERSRT